MFKNMQISQSSIIHIISHEAKQMMHWKHFKINFKCCANAHEEWKKLLKFFVFNFFISLSLSSVSSWRARSSILITHLTNFAAMTNWRNYVKYSSPHTQFEFNTQTTRLSIIYCFITSSNVCVVLFVTFVICLWSFSVSCVTFGQFFHQFQSSFTPKVRGFVDNLYVQLYDRVHRLTRKVT